MTAGRFPYLPGVSAGQSSRNVEHLMMTIVTFRRNGTDELSLGKARGLAASEAILGVIAVKRAS